MGHLGQNSQRSELVGHHLHNRAIELVHDRVVGLVVHVVLVRVLLLACLFFQQMLKQVHMYR